MNLAYGRPVFGESIACHDLMFLSVCHVMFCFEITRIAVDSLTTVILLLLENLVSGQSNCPKILLGGGDFYCATFTSHHLKIKLVTKVNVPSGDYFFKYLGPIWKQSCKESQILCPTKVRFMT